jgi:hypothetical protein
MNRKRKFPKICKSCARFRNDCYTSKRIHSNKCYEYRQSFTKTTKGKLNE